MKLSSALKIAESIYAKLQPHCKVIDIAGSIRREQPEVKDIEIVCLPSAKVNRDLFENKIGEERSLQFIEAVIALNGLVLKGSMSTGKYCQFRLPDGIALDLFMPSKEDYYRQFAIRTGSKENSQHIIAAAWLKLGWCGTSEGLRKQTDCQHISDGKWKIINQDGERPPFWKCEQEFFEWLNVKWIEPKLR